MELIVKLDRCGYHEDIMEIFEEFLSDLFLSFDLDYENDFDHRDRGALADSINAYGFNIEYFPKIYGFKVFYKGELVGEFVEIDRVIKKDKSFYYEFTFEVWTDQEESIYTGEE